MAETKPPKVFISYAWEDDLKTWVLDFATRLRSDGINAILDQWETAPGDQLPEFMEKSVRESDFVVFVCTPTYKRKSDRRKGGVGYEGHIITGEVFQKNNHRKFIPVLRKGKSNTALPSWAISKYYIDFRGEPYSETSYQHLLDTLFGKSPTAPPLREKLARESFEKAEREKKELELAEKTAREMAERERLEREAAEKIKHEKAERQKAEKEAKEKARYEEIKKRRLPYYETTPLKKTANEELKYEKSQPKKTKPPRKPNTAIIVALIGLAGTIGAALLSSPLIEKWFAPTPVSAVPITSTNELLPATLIPIVSQTTTLTQSVPTISTVPLPSETPSVTEYQIGYLQDTQDSGEYYDDLFVVNFSGDATKIVSGFTGQTNYAVSENGQYIARNGDGVIYYVNNATGEESPLIDSVYQRNYDNITWSNDGKYIFATVNGSYTTGNWWQGYIYNYWIKYYIISTSDSALTELADRSGSHAIKNVRWSPDDKFVSYWESGDIFTFDPGTRQINNITKSGLVSETSYSWSPDANQILFTLTDDNSIYVLDMGTGAKVSLIDSIDGTPRTISWDPEGEKISYSFYYNSNQIYVFDIATRENSFLTEGENPVWSPDGARLLYLNNNDVFVVDADATNQINLTNSPNLPESEPFWVDLSTAFEIQTDEIISETFGSNYTYCTWGYEPASSDIWVEYQCACSETYCTCTQIQYVSRTKRTELYRSGELIREKREVEKNVAEFGGTCD